MTQQISSNRQRGEKNVRLILRAVAIVGILAGLACAPAMADWAEQMGEGSGVDRGVALSSAVSGGGQTQQQNLDAPALREAMTNSIASDLAVTLSGGAVPEAYSAPVFVVPSIAACEDDDCEEADPLAD